MAILRQGSKYCERHSKGTKKLPVYLSTVIVIFVVQNVYWAGFYFTLFFMFFMAGVRMTYGTGFYAMSANKILSRVRWNFVNKKKVKQY